MKRSNRKPSDKVRRKYESPDETKAAIARIHDYIKKSQEAQAIEKQFAESPEGILRSTLRALLNARKTIATTRKELDAAISTLRRCLPRKLP